MYTVDDISTPGVKTQNVCSSGHQCSRGLKYRMSTIVDIRALRVKTQKDYCSRQHRGLGVKTGGGPRVVVSTAAFHARVRGSVPGLSGLKVTKNVSSPSTCESQYCGEPP